MPSYQRPAWVKIDLEAIKGNIAAIKSLLSKTTEFMAVVKANAYGHGLIPTALATIEGGADRLGVALLEEATDLRSAGVTAPIHILSEIPLDGVEQLVQNDIIPGVYSYELAAAISETAKRLGKRCKIHLKVDTGMHRAGLPFADVIPFYQRISVLKNLEIEGIFTHFACADTPGDAYTGKQLDLFLSLKPALGGVPCWHAANSAAAFFMPESRLDMVRIGIAMYGLEASENSPSPITLRPALSLHAKIAYIRELGPGDGVSYGLTYKMPKRRRVAILPLGYGDGYSRLLSNRAEVIFKGERVKTIGNICMDQLLIELPDGMAAAVGEQVTLIGGSRALRISAEEIARILGTINYETVCMINQRLPRIYE